MQIVLLTSNSFDINLNLYVYLPSINERNHTTNAYKQGCADWGCVGGCDTPPFFFQNIGSVGIFTKSSSPVRIFTITKTLTINICINV